MNHFKNILAHTLTKPLF